MKTILLLLALIFLFACTHQKNVSIASPKSEFKCSVMHQKENPKAKVGALICGEFLFDLENIKFQNFENCQGLSVAYTPMVTPTGWMPLIEMSLSSTKKSTRFMAKYFPEKFSLELVSSWLEKKHLMDDAYILDCSKL